MIEEHKEDTELEELEINTYKSIKLILQQNFKKKKKPNRLILKYK